MFLLMLLAIKSSCCCYAWCSVGSSDKTGWLTDCPLLPHTALSSQHDKMMGRADVLLWCYLLWCCASRPLTSDPI